MGIHRFLVVIVNNKQYCKEEAIKENYSGLTTQDLGSYLNGSDLTQILRRPISSRSPARNLISRNSAKVTRRLEWLDEILGQLHYYIPSSLVGRLRQDVRIFLRKLEQDEQVGSTYFSQKQLFNVIVILLIDHHKRRGIRTSRTFLQELTESCFPGSKLRPSDLLDAKALLRKHGLLVVTSKQPSLRSAILNSSLILRRLIEESLTKAGYTDLDLLFQDFRIAIEREIYPRRDPVLAVLILMGWLVSTTQVFNMSVQEYCRIIYNITPIIQERFPTFKLQSKDYLANAIYRFRGQNK